MRRYTNVYPGLAFAALVAAACGPARPPAPIPAADGATCVSACENVEKVRAATLAGGGDVAGCKVAEPTRAGASCLVVCTNAEANGVNFEVSCLTAALTCAAAYRCGREP